MPSKRITIVPDALHFEVEPHWGSHVAYLVIEGDGEPDRAVRLVRSEVDALIFSLSAVRDEIIDL